MVPIPRNPALEPGARLGPYEIVAPIGAGGMGEVYRARDTRLERLVAVKVLPADVALDPAARERFEREARAVAALNHPHISVLHDVGCHEGIDFLVMEYLDGETLSERLTRGALPLSQALEYGIQIADALARAHGAGIVHRDLKPGNVMLTRGGTKLLDFGLAKWRASAVDSASSALPTRDLTAQGAIVGTLQYMSPEQLEGKEADSRADLWALGVVFYEMVTGRKAFDGRSQAGLIAAILEHEPPSLSSVMPLSPPLLNRLVERCLVKDRGERAQSAADVRATLRWIAEKTTEGRPIRGRGSRLAWMTAGLVVAGLLFTLGGVVLRPPAVDTEERRVQIVTPATTDPISLAVSPDGRRLVFVGSSEGRSVLWLRDLDSFTATPLPGSEDAHYPFWSPDSQSVAFFAFGKLRRLDLSRGTEEVLADAARGMGGTWSDEGGILFSPVPGGALYRVPPSGGEPVEVTRLTPLETSHRFPQFLPDGRHFVFHVGGGTENRGVYLASLDQPEARQRLVLADAAAVAAPGHLLYGRGETLLAHSFDVQTLALTGEPFVVVDSPAIEYLGLGSVGAWSASRTGVVAFRTQAAGGIRTFVWFDRAGKRLDRPRDLSSPSIANPELSPEGRRVAFNQITNGNSDIWVLDMDRGVESRVTFDEGLDHSPLWSPDGSRLVFWSNRSGIRGIYTERASGGDGGEALFARMEPFLPTDWSRDGRFILCRELNAKTGYDLWVLPFSNEGGNPALIPFASTSFQEREGKFSPDGRFIVYQSDESGRYEVYLQAFPGPGGKLQVSTEGGAQPRFRADGREIFYLALDGTLMAVPITWRDGGQTPDPGPPVALFPTRIAGGAILAPGPVRHQYTVSGDGQRFLVNVETSEPGASPIDVILDWNPQKPR